MKVQLVKGLFPALGVKADVADDIAGLHPQSLDRVGLAGKLSDPR
jgi:hypothetical protein